MKTFKSFINEDYAFFVVDGTSEKSELDNLVKQLRRAPPQLAAVIHQTVSDAFGEDFSIRGFSDYYSFMTGPESFISIQAGSGSVSFFSKPKTGKKVKVLRHAYEVTPDLRSLVDNPTKAHIMTMAIALFVMHNGLGEDKVEIISKKRESATKERDSVSAIRSALASAVAATGGPITLYVDGKAYKNVYEIAQVGIGKKKVDARFLSPEGTPVLDLSLKHSTARAYHTDCLSIPVMKWFGKSKDVKRALELQFQEIEKIFKGNIPSYIDFKQVPRNKQISLTMRDSAAVDKFTFGDSTEEGSVDIILKCAAGSENIEIIQDKFVLTAKGAQFMHRGKNSFTGKERVILNFEYQNYKSKRTYVYKGKEYTFSNVLLNVRPFAYKGSGPHFEK